MPFAINPAWSFREFLDHLFAYYRGGGSEGTGYRLNAMRNWLSMAGRTRALDALAEIERAAETSDKAQIAESLWMAERSWRALIKFARNLPNDDTEQKKAIRAFVSYKWQAGKHVAWVRKLSADLRARGIEAILDQWEVRLGESFTDFMQENIATADVILFVITPEAVKAAEAPKGKGGALKFEVQMMNARRMAEGTRIIGIYRAGKRPPRYLRDHRYIDFRDDQNYENSLLILVDDILGRGGAPQITRT